MDDLNYLIRTIIEAVAPMRILNAEHMNGIESICDEIGTDKNNNTFLIPLSINELLS